MYYINSFISVWTEVWRQFIFLWYSFAEAIIPSLAPPLNPLFFLWAEGDSRRFYGAVDLLLISEPKGLKPCRSSIWIFSPAGKHSNQSENFASRRVPSYWKFCFYISLGVLILQELRYTWKFHRINSEWPDVWLLFRLWVSLTGTGIKLTLMSRACTLKCMKVESLLCRNS